MATMMTHSEFPWWPWWWCWQQWLWWITIGHHCWINMVMLIIMVTQWMATKIIHSEFSWSRSAWWFQKLFMRMPLLVLKFQSSQDNINFKGIFLPIKKNQFRSRWFPGGSHIQMGPIWDQVLKLKTVSNSDYNCCLRVIILQICIYRAKK